MRSFGRAKKYIFVDDKEVKDSVAWFRSKQKINGCFPQYGKLFNRRLQVVMKLHIASEWNNIVNISKVYASFNFTISGWCKQWNHHDSLCNHSSFGSWKSDQCELIWKYDMHVWRLSRLVRADSPCGKPKETKTENVKPKPTIILN